LVVCDNLKPRSGFFSQLFTAGGAFDVSYRPGSCRTEGRSGLFIFPWRARRRRFRGQEGLTFCRADTFEWGYFKRGLTRRQVDWPGAVGASIKPQASIIKFQLGKTLEAGVSVPGTGFAENLDKMQELFNHGQRL
jgi:hypothetical protein